VRESRRTCRKRQAADAELAAVIDEDGAGEAGALARAEVGEREGVEEVAVAEPGAGGELRRGAEVRQEDGAAALAAVDAEALVCEELLDGGEVEHAAKQLGGFIAAPGATKAAARARRRVDAGRGGGGGSRVPGGGSTRAANFAAGQRVLRCL